ncbi:MAG: DUF2271 domain-containing protein [Treponema sp.]|jgi:hypothetical protein|nr:DUF2271 domain-containing protein [Treponema sp.]
MKKIIFISILTALVISYASAQQAAAEITFTFTRQSGSASNQYAVWIENAQGQLVKTLYATRWTANGGYRSRPSSIPVWVRLSDLANMNRSQIDAVSSATPRTGTATYTWDGTDSRGAAVPAGNYVMVLEGTLRWENQVLYRAPFRLGQGTASPQVSAEYQGDSTAERGMISNVRVRVLR